MHLYSENPKFASAYTRENQATNQLSLPTNSKVGPHDLSKLLNMNHMYTVKLIYFTLRQLNPLTANGNERRVYLHLDRPLLGHPIYISSFEDPRHQRSQIVNYHQQQQTK